MTTSAALRLAGSSSRGRFYCVADGRPLRAADPPVVSSADSPWAGFFFQRTAVSSGYARHMLWPETCIVLMSAGSVTVKDRHQPSFVAGLDSITIWPAGHEGVEHCWSGSFETVSLALDHASLARLAPDDPHLRAFSLLVQGGIYDPHLTHLIRAMEAEVCAGCPAGPLYAESLSLALAAYLSSRYSVARPPQLRPDRQLTRRELGRLLEFIHANLGREMRVAELSRTIDLSPSHFIELFRRSLGTTPHQYLIRERVAEAKRLLASGRMSIAEVAYAVGFSSQSHFTEIFRRKVGISPKRYRQEA